jgi:hypothetical protein
MKVRKSDLIFLDFLEKFSIAAKKNAERIEEGPLEDELSDSEKKFEKVSPNDPDAPTDSVGVYEKEYDTGIPNLKVIRRTYSLKNGQEETVEIEEYTKDLKAPKTEKKVFKQLPKNDPYASKDAVGVHEEHLDTKIPNLSVIRRTYSLKNGQEEVVEIEEYTKNIKDNPDGKVFKTVCKTDQNAPSDAVAYYDEKIEKPSSKKKTKRTYLLLNGNKKEIEI